MLGAISKIYGYPAAPLVRVAASIVGLLMLNTTTIKAQTALEMQSYCRGIITAKVSSDTITFVQDFYTGICWGAFSAIQGVTRFQDENEVRILHVCMPSSVTRSQIIKIFSDYVEKNLKHGHWDYEHIALNALVEAFPCDKSSLN